MARLTTIEPWALKVAERAKAALKAGRKGTHFSCFVDGQAGVRELRLGWKVVATLSARQIARTLSIGGRF